MQISAVSNQQNFGGQIIVKDAICHRDSIQKSLKFVSLTSERIESIASNFPKEEVEAAAKTLKRSPFQTIIKMASGDIFEVRYSPEEISGAKKMVDGTSQVIDAYGMNLALRN